MRYILGLSAFYHDSAAALLADGEIAAAVQEERFTREKYDSRFPKRSVDYCLQTAGIGPDRIDYVAFYEQPLTKFERLIETYTAYAPDGFASFRQAIPVWLKQKLHLPREIRDGLDRKYKGRIFYPAHHESHAASAFFPSPFEEAAILTLDGVGEWTTSAIGLGRGGRIELIEELRFPHSLGLLYSAFTYYCGFKVNSGEYKLMGLAPYGEPKYVDVILDKLIDLKPDGSFALDMSYFTYAQGLRMTGRKFHDLFGGPPRKTDSRLDQRHMDLASSIQKVTEEIMMRSARHAWEVTGRPDNLVMAGGVALNCVANGRLLREGPFKNIWIQPASGDAGGALGAALFAHHHILGKPRKATGHDTQKASLLGPNYPAAQVKSFLDDVKASYHSFDGEAALLDHVADQMAQGKIVGWFHGRAEFGPRALGARSIIGDPRSPSLQADLNLKIKFRESFRPFAPCVLREHVHEWFQMRPNEESPYMLQVAPVLDERRTPLTDEQREALRRDPDLSRRVNIVRSQVPAITHVDYSARVQTVDERHGRYYRLMKAFHAKTGCPIIVNTSFNLSWEPIVLTPEQAYHTFMQSEMDVLVVEDYVLHKAEQPLGLATITDDVDGADEDSPWADPLSGDPLVLSASGLRSPETGALYPIVEGIPRLFVPAAGADLGPDDPGLESDYDELDTQRALLESSREDLFARLLSEQIPYDARVLEVGCGTGRLTNFLSIAHRNCLGIDASLPALRVAHRWKTEQEIERAAFAHMNPLRPALRDAFFDYVLATGALGRGPADWEIIDRIGGLVRPGGFLVLRMLNTYGRAMRGVSSIFGGKSGQATNGRTHSLNEAVSHLKSRGFEFVNSVPKPEIGPALWPGERLFDPKPEGSPLGRSISELAHMGASARNGGYFVVIARKGHAAAEQPRTAQAVGQPQLV